MKRALICLVALLFGGLSLAGAQDLLVRRDGQRLKVLVTEISPETVRYKRFTNPDGPTYVLPVGEVSYIEYPNGERDEFAPTPTPAPVAPAAPTPDSAPTSAPVTVPAPVPAPISTPVAPATPTPAPVPAAPADGPQPEPQLQPEPQPQPKPQPQPQPEQTSGVRTVRSYRPGDYYEVDGVVGVVCAVTEDGLHGLVLSLDELFLPWCLLHKERLQTVGADSRDDGRKNMEAVARVIERDGLAWSDFPAFEWCHRKGEGWYLPAIDELLTLGHNYNGGSRMRLDRDARERFNTTLREHGGRKLDRSIYYLSSTEIDARRVWMSHLGLEPPYLNEIQKGTKYLVRAVHRF